MQADAKIRLASPIRPDQESIKGHIKGALRIIGMIYGGTTHIAMISNHDEKVAELISQIKIQYRLDETIASVEHRSITHRRHARTSKAIAENTDRQNGAKVAKMDDSNTV
jgi:hypothetical protein